MFVCCLLVLLFAYLFIPHFIDLDSGGTTYRHREIEKFRDREREREGNVGIRRERSQRGVMARCRTHEITLLIC